MLFTSKWGRIWTGIEWNASLWPLDEIFSLWPRFSCDSYRILNLRLCPRAGPMLSVANNFSFKKGINTKLQWMWDNTFFQERNSHNIKCHTMCFTWKKWLFSRKMITKHGQTVVNSGLNIIPAGDVKMRWIVKVMLRNPKKQFMWRMLKTIKLL